MIIEHQRDFEFTQQHFEQTRKRLYKLAGISLADSKDSLVYSRLTRRIRTLKLSSFAAYFAYLDKSPEETEHFINALTTNLTSFYREAHHFDVLRDYISQRLTKPLTIWCTACSTGEEPYSIAMTAVEAYGSFRTRVQIIASDIDSEVLKVAQNGIYNINQAEKLTKARLQQFFQKGTGNNAGKMRVNPKLQRIIEFKKINLLDLQWNIPAEIDIIFCRNVMIYFDKPTQLKLAERMVSKMKPDGLYFAGHSENFTHISDILQPIGQTVYRPVK